MTGIVFLYACRRVLQIKPIASFPLKETTRPYFPIAVSVLKENNEIPTTLPEIKTGDTLLIHHEELIPPMVSLQAAKD
jgi:Cu+-exporting ATPase